MQNLMLKLKHASAVLGVPTKDLQNMVQLGVLRPARRKRAFWFDTNLLMQTKVAFYLKETLASSSEFLGKFTAAFAKNAGNTKIGDLEDIWVRSRPLHRTDAVELKIPIRALARELEEQLPRAMAYEYLPKGKDKAGRKKDSPRSAQKASGNGGIVSEEEILKNDRDYKVRKKKRPEITVVSRSK